MVLTLSDVQIFNQALIRLGKDANLVTAVDGTDTSKFGKLAYPLYYLTRDEELRSSNQLVSKKRVQLAQAQVTDTNASWTNTSTTMTVTTTVGIRPGWLIANVLQQGGGNITTPRGIPAGSTVLSITDGTHVVMSLPATATDSGLVIFQANNLTGFWYVYEVPSDILLASSVYSVFPSFAFIWPFKVPETVPFDYRYENGYIYTNLDPSFGNPVIEYIRETGARSIYITGTTSSGSKSITSTSASLPQGSVGYAVSGSGIPVGAFIGTILSTTITLVYADGSDCLATVSGTLVALTLDPAEPFFADFVERLAMRVAGKLAYVATNDLNLKKDINGEYLADAVRSDANNAREAQADYPGHPWWTNRGRL